MMLVGRKIPGIDHRNIDQAGIAGPANNAATQNSAKHFRKQRYDINVHGFYQYSGMSTRIRPAAISISFTTESMAASSSSFPSMDLTT